MKLRFSRITLWFAALGLWFALVEAVLSLLYTPTMNPVMEAVVRELGTGLVLFCPFALGFGELPHVHILSDKVWIYFEVIALNTLLYFVLGLGCSSMVRIIRAVIANRPR